MGKLVIASEPSAETPVIFEAAAGETAASPFPSFFMGGFECSMPTLPDGRRLDQIAASQHDVQLAADYRRLRDAGLLTVREAVRWPLVDHGGRLSLGTLAPVVRALHRAKLTAIWDLFHYGFPGDLDLFTAEFPRRFARYCGAVAGFLTAELPPLRFYTPINEISYFAYAAGQVGYFAPFARSRGPELKRQLVRAALAAVDAIRSADAEARFVHVDPLIHLVAPVEDPGLAPEVERFNQEHVFEAWLMLAGRREPELGGSDAALDIVGANLYPICQWEYQRPNRFLEPGDPRWLPLRDLLRQAWTRLRHPLLIAETGANGPKRPGWLRYLTDEVEAARAAGVPVLGICWYPAVSCPDWHDPTSIFPAGLWDVVPRDHRLCRVPYLPVLQTLAAAEREISGMGEEGDGETGGRGDGETRQPNSPHPPIPPSPRPPVPPSPRLSISRLRISDAHQCPAMPENFGQSALVAGDHLAVRSYCLQPGQSVSIREYPGIETALCVLEGTACIEDCEAYVSLRQGQVILIPAGLPFGMKNAERDPCLILQISTPRPWSADFQGPEPADEVMRDEG